MTTTWQHWTIHVNIQLRYVIFPDHHQHCPTFAKLLNSLNFPGQCEPCQKWESTAASGLTTSSRRFTPRLADGDCGRLGGALPGWLLPLATTDSWPLLCVASAAAPVLSSSLFVVLGHQLDMSLVTLSVSNDDCTGFTSTQKTYITRRALGRAHLPPTKVFRRLSE